MPDKTAANGRVSRRKILGGAVALGAAGAVGGGVLFASTRGARAQMQSGAYDTVEIASNDGTVEYVAIYGDSTVEWNGFDEPARYLGLSTAVSVQHPDNGEVAAGEVFSASPRDLEDPDSFTGDEEVELRDGGREGDFYSGIGLYHEGNDEGKKPGTHNSETDWHIIQDPDAASADEYALPPDPLPASALENGDNNQDGGVQEYGVVVTSTYTWYADGGDGPGEELLAEDFDIELTVEVENEPSTSTASDGGGEDGATGE